MIQAKLAEILQHPTDMLAVLHPDNLSVIACNGNLERVLGIKSEQIKGLSIYDVLNSKRNADERSSIIKQLRTCNFYLDKTKESGTHIFLHIVNCEEEHYCIARVSNPDHDKIVLQYLDLFHRNLAGVYRADFSGELLSCNQAFAEILGYEDPAQLIGLNTSTFYQNVKQREKYLSQLKKEPVIQNFELNLVKRDGTIATCLENAYLENLPDGSKRISGTLIDISEKKKIENELHDSEQRFKAIASVTNEGVIFSVNNRIVECNDQFAHILGYYSSAEVINRPLADFFQSNDIKRVLNGIEISAANRHEVRANSKDGRPVVVEITGSFIRYRGHKTLALVADDITTRKKSELALQQSDLSFRRLLENTPNGVLILSEGNIQHANLAACEMLGVEDEDELFDQSIIPFLEKDFRNQMRLDLSGVRSGKEIPYKEVKLVSATGEQYDVGLKLALTVFENKPAVQLTLNNVSARNQLVQEQIRMRFIEEINTVLKAEIAEHKTTREKLEREQRKTLEQKAKLESIFNSTENLLMWTVNKRFVITAMNKNFAEWMMNFFGEKVSVGENIMHALERHLDEDFYQGQLKAFENGFKGRPQQFEFALKSVKGQTVWLQAFLNPVYLDGRQEELSCLLYDNTERKEFDKKIRESLKEKEILLQEVHHRVKNNLQVISSILNLQSSYVSDPATLEILRESQERIKSMSFIHETLYRTADFSRLEFTNYICTIAGNLVQSYKSQEREIELQLDTDNVYLNLDQSIPCGLIVNELVSNALKYAFAGRKHGILHVGLHEKNGTIEVIVRDNGVGLPPDFSYEKTNSLGIQLVYALLEQLDADMKVKSDGGTEFYISFQRK